MREAVSEGGALAAGVAGVCVLARLGNSDVRILADRVAGAHFGVLLRLWSIPTDAGCVPQL